MLIDKMVHILKQKVLLWHVIGIINLIFLKEQTCRNETMRQVYVIECTSRLYSSLLISWNNLIKARVTWPPHDDNKVDINHQKIHFADCSSGICLLQMNDDNEFLSTSSLLCIDYQSTQLSLFVSLSYQGLSITSLCTLCCFCFSLIYFLLQFDILYLKTVRVCLDATFILSIYFFAVSTWSSMLTDNQELSVRYSLMVNKWCMAIV